MMNRTALLVCVAGATIARADLLYTERHRELHVAPPARSDFAPDFLPWTAELKFWEPSLWYGADATQVSELGPGAIDVFERAWAADGYNGSWASAASTLDVTFTLDNPSPFSLDAFCIQASGGGGSGESTIALSSGGVDVFRWSRTGYKYGQYPIAFTGVLGPGSYRFEVISKFNAYNPYGAHTGLVEFTATLTVPPPSSVAAILMACGGVMFRWPRRRGRTARRAE